MNYQTTTILVIRNNESVIERTLKSLRSPILVADIGSEDKTPDICKEYGATVYKIKFNYDYSIVRNTISQKAVTEWILWINPGETLESGHEYLEMEKEDLMYRVMVLKNDLLTKETRLTRKNHKFIRPIFEIIYPDLSEQTLPIVISGSSNIDFQMECLTKWKDKNPLSPEPDYCLACMHLMNNKLDSFLELAEQFLFQKKDIDESAILIKYYMALLYKNKNIGKSLQLILECLIYHPLMAEFWCLLGDLYLVHIKEYDRAYHFYENAIILGSRRLAEDLMPMEISKYDEYPRKMMDVIQSSIRKILSNSSHEEQKTNN